tara:strand:- start:731 stop:1975 length:1245 start_codon:yes stop_codon:yes gene_type:complete
VSVRFNATHPEAENKVVSRFKAFMEPIKTKVRPVVAKWLNNNAMWLVIGGTLFLVGMGMLMGTSASMDIAASRYNDAFFFLKRQLIYLFLSCFCCAAVLKIPIIKWRVAYPWLLLLSTVGLIFVLVPGIGKSVNGSARWIGFGPFNIQVSEFSKWFLVLFVADYIVRRKSEIQTNVMAFIKPMLIVGVTVLLLLAEPDFGASAVIVGTTLMMLFVAGSSLLPFITLLALLLISAGMLVMFQEYRWERIIAYTDPWMHQFNSGYQLTQSLIAFGQGGLTGRGLGESVQKLFYLPEAHTDFVFAVLAEELGLVMCLTVCLVYSLLTFGIFCIAYRALKRSALFESYAVFGVGLLVSIQAILNMGVNTGLLPTKGLTLPLMSYGGSSILVTLSMLAFVLRVEYENRRPTRFLGWSGF